MTTSYEAWDPDPALFDAVFACNSFHWVDRAIRFHKSAGVLRPWGHLIVLATPWVVPDDADRFWWDVQDDYVAVGAERVDPATKHPDRTGGARLWTVRGANDPAIPLRRHLHRRRLRRQPLDPVGHQGALRRRPS